MSKPVCDYVDTYADFDRRDGTPYTLAKFRDEVCLSGKAISRVPDVHVFISLEVVDGEYIIHEAFVDRDVFGLDGTLLIKGGTEFTPTPEIIEFCAEELLDDEDDLQAELAALNYGIEA